MQEEFVADNTAAGAEEPAQQPSFATEDAAALSGGEESADSLTRTFSERLKTMSGKKVDEFIAGLGLVDPVRGEEIRSREEFDAWRSTAQTLQEALQDKEQPEAPEEELTALRSEVQSLRMLQQERALLEDPVHGPIYSRMKEAVQQVGEVPGVSLDAAYAAVLLRELPGLLAHSAEDARSQALRTVQANGTASPGALGGAAAPDIPDFENMPSSEFAAYRRRVLHDRA